VFPDTGTLSQITKARLIRLHSTNARGPKTMASALPQKVSDFTRKVCTRRAPSIANAVPFHIMCTGGPL
jgi:hypothetical protein